jgi:hypothetical protein
VEASTSNLLQWIVGHWINPLSPNRPGHPNWGGILGQALMCMVFALAEGSEPSESQNSEELPLQPGYTRDTVHKEILSSGSESGFLVD